jgi:hypothetical protein
MSDTKNLKAEIIKWNNENPLDSWWRKRYKVPFGSSAHLEISQWDILFVFLEQKIYSDYIMLQQDLSKKEERLKNNGWLSTNSDVSDEDFDNIKID